MITKKAFWLQIVYAIVIALLMYLSMHVLFSLKLHEVLTFIIFISCTFLNYFLVSKFSDNLKKFEKQEKVVLISVLIILTTIAILMIIL